jgi:raffinose/stachyose/melibiose transport system substrate-binding protein
MKTLLCAAATAVVALAGTAQADELKLWTLNFANVSANQAFKEIIGAFEAANPGVTVKIENRGTDEHKAALRVAAGSDQGPDIYFMWAGPGLGGEFVKAGLSLPLDKYYAQYKWDDRFLPIAGSFSKIYEGGRHGVPYTIHGEAIYFNKALFAKAGVKGEIKTYDDLLAAAAALKKAGIPAFTFGGTVNWHVMRLMDVLLETKCGAEKHDALTNRKASWAAEACVGDAFKELANWSANSFLKPFMGIDQAQSFNLFLAGKAAMMLEGDWLVDQLRTAKKLDAYEVVPFPTGTERLYGFAEYNYISTKSKNPDAAAKFLDYLESTEVQRKYIGQFGTTSVDKDVKSSSADALDVAWGKIFAAKPTMFVNGDQALPLNVATEYMRLINEVASGNLDTGAAGPALQTFIDEHK